uniref:Uncharacterized protein n=1 Tax=Arundo donax TaxID=35708 RepID=A0A0A8Y844_ARUDO
MSSLNEWCGKMCFN